VKKSPVMKTSIVIDLPDHVAEAVVELSKTIDLGTLLRDALGEFASRRTSVAKYVALRYNTTSGASFDRKVDEVERRIALAEAIHSGVARVVEEKLPELKQCQGDSYYKKGWYVQGNDGFMCEHGKAGHNVTPGEKMYIDEKGHIFCEAHAFCERPTP
jgi:hypothetical protein